MQKLDFNKGWICRCLTREEPAYPVTLPHDAMRTEKRIPQSMGEGNIGGFEGGAYEYTKKFIVPDDVKGKQLTLEFESVYHNAEVYVNGEQAAFRPYGYINFYVELNPYLHDGENEIRVIARNSDQPNSRWYPGTGIYRPVWLYVADEKHILMNGVKIRTLKTYPATIQLDIEVSGEGEVTIDIIKDGKSVVTANGVAKDGKLQKKLEIPDPKLWNVDTPELYTARISYVEDTWEETFGIRKLDWNPTHGLLINGSRVILRGACIHHDNGVLGACTYPEAEERKVRILKENGYTAIRSSHYPVSKYMLDACDKLGMLMMDEYVDVWYMHKTSNDYATYLMDWWKQDLKDLVEKDYNHPCVIMYSTGNEVAESAQPKGIALQQDFTNYLHSLDPTRPVTCGINIFFNFLSSVGLGVYSDDKAKKLAEEAAKSSDTTAKPKKKKSVGSEFYNMLAVKLGCNFMKTGAALPMSDWKTRDACAVMDIAGYNYGLFRYKKDLKKYPKRLILGSETLVTDAYAFWEIAKDNPRIIGDFVWSGWDYIGETGMGAASYKEYYDERPETQMTGGNGRITLSGKPNAEAAYTRVALEQEPGPNIAVFPANTQERPEVNGWHLTMAMESWAYRGYTGQKTIVEVYARAAEVELFINNKSVGRKPLKNNCRVKFDVVYEDGEITAVSYDAHGAEIGRKTLKTAGAETVLSVRSETETIKPEGLAFIRLQYTDEAGIWKPLEKHKLSIKVENGELMGFGNDCPYFEGNYAQTTVPTYFGEANAVVRADGTGPVLVTVTDETQEVTCTIPLA